MAIMTASPQSLEQTLSTRFLIEDRSDPDIFSKLKPGDGVYCGFDPTAPSLHIGNLQQIIVAIHVARAGLRPFMLFGGATGAVGDPSGRSSERPMLSLEEIEANVERHASLMRVIFERAGVSPTFVNNATWTNALTLLDFLRDFGKHIPVNYLLNKDYIKTRLETGISYTEFTYNILQGMDFYHLWKNEGVKAQYGGTDQWGNIVTGLELIRRKSAGEAYTFSSPLITDSSGKKLGKSSGGGGLWLHADMMSPFKFHQFFLNVADNDAISLLKKLTFVPLDEIAALAQEISIDGAARHPQNRLADEMCTFIHGSDQTLKARKAARALFGETLTGFSDAELEDIFADVPSSEVSRSLLKTLTTVDLFAQTLCKSKGEARRLAESGGMYLNNERRVGTEALGDPQQSVLVLRSGKKSYHLVKIR